MFFLGLKKWNPALAACLPLVLALGCGDQRFSLSIAGHQPEKYIDLGGSNQNPEVQPQPTASSTDDHRTQPNPTPVPSSSVTPSDPLPTPSSSVTPSDPLPTPSSSSGGRDRDSESRCSRLDLDGVGQGAWGADQSQSPHSRDLDQRFSQLFGRGLLIGMGSGNHVLLRSAEAVRRFLPAGGRPGPISSRFTDPNRGDLRHGGSLAGHLVALKLNLAFGDSRALSRIILNSQSALDGLTVAEAVDRIDRAMSSGVPPQGFRNFAQLLGLIARLNHVLSCESLPPPEVTTTR